MRSEETRRGGRKERKTGLWKERGKERKIEKWDERKKQETNDKDENQKDTEKKMTSWKGVLSERMQEKVEWKEPRKEQRHKEQPDQEKEDKGKKKVKCDICEQHLWENIPPIGNGSDEGKLYMSRDYIF